MSHLISTIVVASSLLLLRPVGADFKRPVPPAPKQSVYDETQSLLGPTSTAIESLLIEHQQLTGEQIIVAVFKGLEGEDFSAWNQKIFTDWKVGTEALADNGVLLSIDGEHKTADLVVGYGLEAGLTEDQQEKIISDYLEPDLKQGKIDSALLMGVYLTLEALNSPLIQSGKAEEILKINHLPSPEDILNNPPEAQNWIIAFILGILSLVGVFVLILTRKGTRDWKETFLRWIPGRSKNFLLDRDISNPSDHSDTPSDSGRGDSKK